MNHNEAISSFEEYIRSEGAGDDFQLPKHKIVCPDCKGKGTVGPSWVFTEEDRYEMGYEFDEMMEDMGRGVYDQVCPQCQGQNVIDEIDEDALEENLKMAWHNWLKDIADEEAIYRMERMMGA